MIFPQGSPRTAVLLGAGASYDAGLPLTHQFAGKLIDQLETDYHRVDPLVRGVYFVYGAMVGYYSRRGRDPRAAVNVETLISALRLLQERDEHEVAPFVVSWNDMHDRFALPSYAEHAHSLERVVIDIVTDEYPPGDRLEQLIRKIAYDVMSSPGDASLYSELEDAIAVRVRRILLAHGPTDYLRPLLDAAAAQPGGMDVATLNYDLTVEHAAEDVGVVVDPGPADPRPGSPLTFAKDAALRLYKLHGSVDLRQEYSEIGDTRRMRTVRDTSDDEFAPRIVIGDRDKLGSGGATLALLVGFAQALEKADRLVVVGYSFGDDHVNNLIFDWLDADVSRTLTVLDPSWPHPGDGWDPRLDLTRKLADAQPLRIAVVRATASQGLERALSLTPTAEPDPRFAVSAAWSGESAVVTFQNLGSELTSVRMTTNLLAEPSRMTISRADAVEESSRTLVLPLWGAGEAVEVHLEYRAGTSPRGLSISGDDDVAHIDERWEFTDPPTRHPRLR
ncbi:MAG: SIR2 family protein [Microbacterium sp.]|uniref:SIR2 family protein n=1 Tax=Microbacterium sp. TaxID=51671 RepID=UPI003BB107E4